MLQSGIIWVRIQDYGMWDIGIFSFQVGAVLCDDMISSVAKELR